MSKTSDPSVSVALCTFNGAAHLAEQLRSIAEQTQAPHELVVCDDRSSDQTVEIVQRFVQHAPFPVRIVRNERTLGIARNFEQAVGLCRGEIILLCDQDDYWSPEKVRRFAAMFSAYPEVEGFFSDALVTDPQLRPTGESLWSYLGLTNARRAQVMSENAIDAVIWGNPVYGTVFGIRARALEFLLPMPHPLPGLVIHDGWMATVLGCRKTLRGFDEKLSYYREHSAQQSGVAHRLPPTLFERLRRPAAERNSAYAAHLDELKRMYELLSHHRASATFDLRPLAERIRFCEFRLALPHDPLQRARRVVTELRRGSYSQQTGRRLQPAVRDLLRF